MAAVLIDYCKFQLNLFQVICHVVCIPATKFASDRVFSRFLEKSLSTALLIVYYFCAATHNSEQLQ